MRPETDKIPTSVYRLQLSEKFNFDAALHILPYLKDLGIDAVYLSPIYEAFTVHGYDVTDPLKIRENIGGKKGFESFCAKLQALNMKLVIDVIPNHMGIQGGKNAWWQDVLENGPHSEFANFFDINWNSEKRELQDKILLPFLGDFYGRALENQEIKLVFKEGKFQCHYGSYQLPLNPSTYPQILDHGIEELETILGFQNPVYQQYRKLIDFFRYFPSAKPDKEERKKEGEEHLQNLIKESVEIKAFIQSRVTLFNGKKRDPSSFDPLNQLLESQYYRLAYWRVASQEINYRRFFNINELVAIRVEDEAILNAHHHLIFELVEKDVVQGLRIDHPDGLYDPALYFERIRERFPIYIIVEKILDRREELPSNWDVDGTVGYEFINIVNGLFIKRDQEKFFTDLYEQVVHEKMDFEKILNDSKKQFTTLYMASEINSLGLYLDGISEKNRYYRDFTREELTKALQEVIAHFPVYRTYISPLGGVAKRDVKYIQQAILSAALSSRELNPLVLDFLRNILLVRLKNQEDDVYRNFILKFQQLTAPIMAKGMEDTAFYRYNRFISLNEVGGSPDVFGNFISDFHHFNRKKYEKWPFGFLASSTHDTKRSLDVRMRLNVLSEIPDAFALELKKWQEASLSSKNEVDGKLVPSANTEYFIYQTLLGIWPLSVQESSSEENIERIWECLLKSVREAKQETDWLQPNLPYEEALQFFLRAILSKESLFLHHFIPFVKRIDRFGAWNSLSAEVLKLGSPGVVDLYQGDEIWNFRLVDPDNRREVDYEKRKEGLNYLKRHKSKDAAFFRNLFSTKDYGRIKLFIYWKSLNFRSNHKSLMLNGEYLPLRVRGQRSEHVIAYMRRYEDQVLIVATGRFFATMINTDWGLPTGSFIWGDTEIQLPKQWRGKKFVDLFTNREIPVRNSRGYSVLKVAELFEFMPYVFLH